MAVGLYMSHGSQYSFHKQMLLSIISGVLSVINEQNSVHFDISMVACMLFAAKK